MSERGEVGKREREGPLQTSHMTLMEHGYTFVVYLFASAVDLAAVSMICFPYPLGTGSHLYKEEPTGRLHLAVWYRLYDCCNLLSVFSFSRVTMV